MEKQEAKILLEEIGARIRSCRERTNMKVSEAADAIKTSVNNITLIEKGKFDFTAPVYAKYFIKSYLQLLKIDDKDIFDSVDNYFKNSVPKINATQYSNSSTITNPQQLFVKKKKNYFSDLNFLNYVVFFVIALGTLAIFYFLFFNGSKEAPKADPKQIAQTKIIQPVDTSLAKNDKPKQDATRSDSLILEVTASGSSWVKVSSEGATVEELTMTAGQNKRWAAKNELLFNIGNAGALSIKRNGMLLAALGKSGSVLKNVRITKDTVIVGQRYDQPQPMQTADTKKNIPKIINNQKNSSTTSSQSKSPTPKKKNNKNKKQNIQPQKTIILTPSPIKKTDPFKKQPN